MSPLPTPYDIIAPTPYPFTPSIDAWLFLVVAGILAMLLIVYLLKRLEPRAPLPEKKSVEQQFQDELQWLLDRSSYPDTKKTEYLSRSIRRFLERKLHIAATSMTAAELKRNTRSEDYSVLIELIDDLDKRRYSPSCPENYFEKAITSVRSALHSMQKFEESA